MRTTRLTALAAATILMAEAASAVAIRPGDLLVTDTDANALIHVDPVTGDRTILSSPTVGGGSVTNSMVGPAVESTGQVVVTSTLDDAVFRIDPNPGDRTVVSSDAMGTGPGFESPLSVAITPTGMLLVSDVLNVVSAIYQVDPVTGDRTILSDASHGQGPVHTPWDIALEASGDIVVATFNGVLRVDAITGDRSVVSDGSVGSGPPFSRTTGIAVESDGTLLVTDANQDAVFRVDPITGDREILSVISGPGSQTEVEDIVVGPDGSIYVTDPQADVVRRIDPSTGDNTVISGRGVGLGPVFGRPFGIAVVPSPNETPDCDRAIAGPAELWPPDHEFADVSVVGVTDPDGDPITITVDSIHQDEATWALAAGAGSTVPDGMGVGTELASVRAERNGTPDAPGDGRVYHIAFTADDGMGGSCSGTVTVCVPHDLGRGSDCVDGGPLFDSTLGPACGIGLELAFLLPPLIWLHRRRRPRVA